MQSSYLFETVLIYVFTLIGFAMLLIKLVFFLIVRIIVILWYLKNLFSWEQIKENMRDEKVIKVLGSQYDVFIKQMELLMKIRKIQDIFLSW